MPIVAHQKPIIPLLPCACASLRRTARVVTQLYDRELSRAGLSVTQFTLLQALARLEGVTQRGLGERLALDSTTLSRTLNPLEKSGWIEARRGSDRRERRWGLTPEGRRRLEAARPHWERAQRSLGSILGRSGWERLQSILQATARAAFKT